MTNPTSQDGISVEEPRRVQLSRKKGWRMPPNTVSVARPGGWGNPFKVGELKCFINNDDPSDKVIVQPRDIPECVAAFRWLAEHSKMLPLIRSELAGKNLACWCPLDQPCHADVLLELANDPAALRSRASSALSREVGKGVGRG